MLRHSTTRVIDWSSPSSLTQVSHWHSEKNVLFDGIYPQALAHFESVKNRIESLVPNLGEIDLHDHPMGDTEDEQNYRRGVYKTGYSSIRSTILAHTRLPIETY